MGTLTDFSCTGSGTTTKAETSVLQYIACRKNYLQTCVCTERLISPYPDKEGHNLQRQKILSFIYPIYNHNWRNIITIYIYRVSREECKNFGRVFLMLKNTDITQNTYIQSWTVTEIMVREKCGLLWGRRTVAASWPQRARPSVWYRITSRAL
jgi:hypothetical protein